MTGPLPGEDLDHLRAPCAGQLDLDGQPLLGDHEAATRTEPNDDLEEDW